MREERQGLFTDNGICTLVLTSTIIGLGNVISGVLLVNSYNSDYGTLFIKAGHIAPMRIGHRNASCIVKKVRNISNAGSQMVQ